MSPTDKLTIVWIVIVTAVLAISMYVTHPWQPYWIRRDLDRLEKRVEKLEGKQ